MSREEAIRILKNFSLCGVYHQLIRMNDTDAEAISMAIKALEQPERKKGKWIRLTKDLAKCSVCEDYIDNAISCGYNYCPNCGAEMGGGEDG